VLKRLRYHWIHFVCTVFLTGFCSASMIFQATDDLVIEDFEKENYALWKVEGEAFGAGPAKGTLPGQMHVDGFLGQQLVNSFVNGDNSTGSLTSPAFRIERNFISFLIGGGKNQEQLALQLVIDSRVVRSATGLNDTPGGSERLELQYWDVSEFKGQSGTLRIIDQAKGSWGHINVDHIIQSNAKPKGFVQNSERIIEVTSRYIHFPIKNGAPKRVVSLMVDNKLIVRNDIELADATPDWWAPMDVSQWHGKNVTVRVDKLHEDSSALSSMKLSDKIIDDESMYREAMRGQFHFSPKRGWNNDPNGCVFYNGEYHLFFQHNPYGWAWGNMHWGHAVSKDLVRWEELGDKLLPDEMGPMFSGSAVVDWNNSSGFGKDGKPPLVLFYTAAGNPTTQCMAYSTDGRNFTKYSNNPIVKEVTGGNRDPKVIWHEPSRRWVMVLYVEWEKKHTVHFFTSENLKDWTLASIVNGDAPGGGFLYECPDFFELAVDGDASRKKWVLLGANSDYAIGDFDGKRFLPDATRLKGQRGRGFYAAQSFSDVPDGRRIFIGWWQTETKDMPFNQSMTVPLELALKQTDDGPRLTFAPAKDLQSLRAHTHEVVSSATKELIQSPDSPNPLRDVSAELVELEIEFKPDVAKRVLINVRGVEIVYHTDKQEIELAGHRASAPLVNGKQRLIILCDRTGIELFASEGLCYVPQPVNVDPLNRQIVVSSQDGNAIITSLKLHELQSAWNARSGWLEVQ
jgi:fructan beta-fructosidase